MRMTAPPTDAEGDPFADIKAILPETTPVAQQGRDATARGQEYAYLILGPMGSQGPQYNVFLRFRHYAGWAPAWGEKAEAFKVAGTLEGAMGHIETWAGEN